MSAFTLSVRGDVKAVTRDLRRVSRVIVPRITSMALNRAIAKVRTKSIRDVAGAKAIPQSALRGKKAGVPDARRMKEMETENGRLKKLLAESMLENEVTREALRKKW